MYNWSPCRKLRQFTWETAKAFMEAPSNWSLVATYKRPDTSIAQILNSQFHPNHETQRTDQFLDYKMICLLENIFLLNSKFFVCFLFFKNVCYFRLGLTFFLFRFYRIQYHYILFFFMMLS